MKLLAETQLGSACSERLAGCRDLIGRAKLNPDLAEVDVATLMELDGQCDQLQGVLKDAQAETDDDLSKFDETLARISEFCESIESEVGPLAEGVSA